VLRRRSSGCLTSTELCVDLLGETAGRLQRRADERLGAPSSRSAGWQSQAGRAHARTRANSGDGTARLAWAETCNQDARAQTARLRSAAATRPRGHPVGCQYSIRACRSAVPPTRTRGSAPHGVSPQRTTDRGALVEQSGRKGRQPLANASPRTPLDYLLSSAIACIQLRRMLHGKEGLRFESGRGLCKSPANPFLFSFSCLDICTDSSVLGSGALSGALRISGPPEYVEKALQSQRACGSQILDPRERAD
jgi:hypothetical protein